MAALLSTLHLVSVLALFLLTARYTESKEKEVKEEETAVSCYSCNSEYDPSCGDPFNPTTIGIVNCSLLPALDHLPKLKPTFCRKNVIVVEYEGVRRTRVVRGCGYLVEDLNQTECVRRSGTHDVAVTYCACSGITCNGAVRHVQHTFLAALIVFATTSIALLSQV